MLHLACVISASQTHAVEKDLRALFVHWGKDGLKLALAALQVCVMCCVMCCVLCYVLCYVCYVLCYVCCVLCITYYTLSICIKPSYTLFAPYIMYTLYLY
jgi:hypothetical protein